MMQLLSSVRRMMRKWNKPAKDARVLIVPDDKVDLLLDAIERYNAQPTTRNELALERVAFHSCPELTDWDGADWHVHVMNGKLNIVEEK